MFSCFSLYVLITENVFTCCFAYCFFFKVHFVNTYISFCYVQWTLFIVAWSEKWCRWQGGTKVLVTGPWCEPASKYAVHFDNDAVPATMVQSGVLRCYTPCKITASLIRLSNTLRTFTAFGNNDRKCFFLYWTHWNGNSLKLMYC